MHDVYLTLRHPFFTSTLFTYYFATRSEYVANVLYFVHDPASYGYTWFEREQIDGTTREVGGDNIQPATLDRSFPLRYTRSSHIKLFSTRLVPSVSFPEHRNLLRWHNEKNIRVVSGIQTWHNRVSTLDFVYVRLRYAGICLFAEETVLRCRKKVHRESIQVIVKNI